MRQVLTFAFWACLVPFIALFKGPDQMTEKQMRYFDSVKLPHSTAVLTLICVVLACVLALAIIVRQSSF